MTPDRSALFLDLHHGEQPLVLPNPWDAGSARILQHLGFKALATTSSGLAASLGRLDGAVTLEETLAHAARISAAVDIPVTADFVNGFADAPEAVAAGVAAASETGLAGCSIEDFTGDESAPIYPQALALERVAAAVSAAHEGPRKLVLTARAEGYLHGRPELAEIIARLQAFQQAGADVLYAPGLTSAADIRALVTSVDRPVNVLLMPGGPSVGELAELGVRRVSVGGSMAYAAYGALADAARELLNDGTTSWLSGSAAGRETARAAFRR